MQKRGQVTVFLIVGLIILFVSGIIIFLVKGANLSVQNSIETESVFLGDQVQNYVDRCLYLTTKEGLFFIGEHGGYYNLPPVYNPDFYLPYYFYAVHICLGNSIIAFFPSFLYVLSKIFCLYLSCCFCCIYCCLLEIHRKDFV